MGKKRERPVSSDSYSAMLDSTLQIHITGDDESSSKKPKKHKRKKSSKKERNDEKQNSTTSQIELVESLMLEDADQDIHIDDDDDMDGDDSFTDSTSVMKLSSKSSDSNGEKMLKVLQKSKSDKSKSSSTSKVKKKKDGNKGGGDDDTDSEEERWLDAIESGKLEEVDDELKRIKNPRLMTARQRALMEKRSDGVDDAFPTIPAEPLLALPSGFKEKVMTEEMIAKKAIKSKRRREQAIEKREEDKKKTVDRLLKKQDSKISKGTRTKVLKKNVPLISYFSNREGSFLSLPVGMELPSVAAPVERDTRKPIICGVNGCFNLKRYSCSKTAVPLCSLDCYKKNLELKALTPVS